MAKLNTQVTLFKRVGFLDRLLFTKHLSIMLKAGIPLLESIESISDQIKNSYFKSILSQIIKDIDNGKSLHESLTKYPKVFDPLYINLIRIGEESGTLESNLAYLSDQLRKDYEFRKKVIGALMYPMIILTAVFLIGGAISFFVLPQLVGLFQSFGTKLPITTQILLFMAVSMRSYGLFILAGVIGLILGFKLLIGLPAVKPHWHAFLLSLPILGVFLEDAQMSSLSRNLGIMLKSGLPITTALRAEYEASTNLVFKDYVHTMIKAVDKGKKINQELSEAKLKHFPPIAVKMIGVGEKTGNLDESLIYLGEFFEDEVDNLSKNFSTILEPILLLIIGLIVGFVAMSIISPIYQFSGSVTQ